MTRRGAGGWVQAHGLLPVDDARRVQAVRLVHYGTNRWTVHVLRTDGSHIESPKMRYSAAMALANAVRRLARMVQDREKGGAQ